MHQLFYFASSYNSASWWKKFAGWVKTSNCHIFNLFFSFLKGRGGWKGRRWLHCLLIKGVISTTEIHLLPMTFDFSYKKKETHKMSRQWSAENQVKNKNLPSNNRKVIDAQIIQSFNCSTPNQSTKVFIEQLIFKNSSPSNK